MALIKDIKNDLIIATLSSAVIYSFFSEMLDSNDNDTKARAYMYSFLLQICCQLVPIIKAQFFGGNRSRRDPQEMLINAARLVINMAIISMITVGTSVNSFPLAAPFFYGLLACVLDLFTSNRDSNLLVLN